MNKGKKLVIVLSLLIPVTIYAADKLINSPTGNLILDANTGYVIKAKKTIQVDALKNLAGTDDTPGLVPSGSILPYAGTVAPVSWVFAYGQQVSQTGVYAKLYAAIGTIYCTSAHGGSCTLGNFRIPDFRGRIPSGKDNMGGSAANRITTAKTIDGTVLGNSGGSETDTPTGNIPAHYHGMGTGADMSVSIYHDHGSETFNSYAVSSDHTHNFTTGTVSANHTHTETVHTHQIFGTSSTVHNPGSGCYMDGPCGAQSSYTNGAGNYQTGAMSANHTHGGTTGGINQNHYHGVPVNLSPYSGSSTPSGRIGLVTGGCDGNSGSCALSGAEGNNLPPVVMINYIIKL